MNFLRNLHLHLLVLAIQTFHTLWLIRCALLKWLAEFWFEHHICTPRVPSQTLICLVMGFPSGPMVISRTVAVWWERWMVSLLGERVRARALVRVQNMVTAG